MYLELLGGGLAGLVMPWSYFRSILKRVSPIIYLQSNLRILTM